MKYQVLTINSLSLIQFNLELKLATFKIFGGNIIKLLNDIKEIKFLISKQSLSIQEHYDNDRIIQKQKMLLNRIYDLNLSLKGKSFEILNNLRYLKKKIHENDYHNSIKNINMILKNMEIDNIIENIRIITIDLNEIAHLNDNLKNLSKVISDSLEEFSFELKKAEENDLLTLINLVKNNL